MRSVLEDLRYAAAVLRRTPSLTAVAVLTLALGIAATTTVFGWIDGMVLHPSGAPRMTDNSPSSNPSVPAASRLLVFRMPTAGTSRTTSEASPDWRSTKRLLHLSLDILKAQA